MMAGPSFAPLANAEKTIKLLESECKAKELAIKANDTKIKELNKKGDCRKADLQKKRDELKQWREAKQALAKMFTGAVVDASQPRKQKKEKDKKVIEVIQSSDGEDEDSEYGEMLKAEEVSQVELSSKRKSSAAEEGGKRPRINELESSTSTLMASQPFEAPILRYDILDESMSNAPSVVYHPEGKCELRCGFCNGNTMNGKDHLAGWSAMHLHLITDHKTKMDALMAKHENEEWSDSDFVFRFCLYRMVTEDEVAELEAGTKLIELIGCSHDPLPDARKSLANSTSSRSNVPTPTKSASKRKSIRSPTKVKSKKCFICERNVKAEELGFKCKHCSTVVCTGCGEVLHENAEHFPCKKDSDEQTIDDWTKLNVE